MGTGGGAGPPAQQRGVAGGAALPVELAGPFQTRLDQAQAGGLIPQQGFHGVLDCIHGPGVDQEGGVAGHFRTGAEIGGDHRAAAGHGFQDGHAEALVEGREDEAEGAAIEFGQIPGIEEAGDHPDAVDALVVSGLVLGKLENQLHGGGPAQAAESPHHPVQILARFIVGDVQEIGLGRRVRGGAEALGLDAVMAYRDAAFLDARVAHRLAPRETGHGDEGGDAVPQLVPGAELFPVETPGLEHAPHRAEVLPAGQGDGREAVHGDHQGGAAEHEFQGGVAAAGTDVPEHIGGLGEGLGIGEGHHLHPQFGEMLLDVGGVNTEALGDAGGEIHPCAQRVVKHRDGYRAGSGPKYTHLRRGLVEGFRAATSPAASRRPGRRDRPGVSGSGAGRARL